MGGKQSVPVAPSPAVGLAPTPSPTLTAPLTPKTLKDVTLRSVLFGLKDVEVQKGPDGSMILASQVTQEQFDSYVHVLKIMAQLSRLVYCDLSMIREVMLNPVFGTSDNKAVNDAITEADKKYSSMRTTPASGGINGRPMQSYVFPEATDKTTPILKYGSSPSDVTCIILGGDQLKSKQSFFQDTDLIICFKGSSTAENFKHDLLSQFAPPADLTSLMPSGVTPSSGSIGNVPSSFISPVVKSWDLLSKSILEKNPTRLFVTGHSLGGAYATLFSFIVAESYKQVFPSIQTIHLVTFGSPTTMSDKARNVFNNHLDSGIITLDRVTSSWTRVGDIIPSGPAGFSHPGFQPLRTELYPEKNTGRAYNIDTIRKVYQTGGLLGLGAEKNKYELSTKTHMPTRITISTTQKFAHAGYFDMTWLNAFRWYGMKNPGFEGKTFVGYIYQTGISFAYVPSDPTDTETPSAQPGETGQMPTDVPSTGQGRRRTYRKNMKKLRKTMKQ